jgi:hypothetical protein
MDRMQATRKKELRLLARRFFVWTLQGVLSWGTPCCVTVVCFAFHTQIFHAPMPTETAFTALALFNVGDLICIRLAVGLELIPFMSFPDAPFASRGSH